MKEKTPQEKLQDIINEVIELRKQRQKAYGDRWIELEFEGHSWHVIDKANRLKYMLINGNNDYEKAEDTLKDLINYAMFALVKLNENKK